MLATGYASDFKLPPQGEGETDEDFTDRIAGTLRDAGYFIEAHEVAANARYDAEGSTAQTGIAGVLALRLGKADFGTKGADRIMDEQIAGAMALKRPIPVSPEEMLLKLILMKLDE